MIERRMVKVRKKNSISNYLLPLKILSVLCYKLDCDFIDIYIDFYDEKEPIFDCDTFYLPNNLTLPKVFWSIISLYINNIHIISNCYVNDKDKIAILNYFLALIRDFAQKDKYIEFGTYSQKSISMKLNQFPLTWILMKDIIAPKNDICLKNMKIIAGFSPYVDSAIYIDKNNYKDSGIDLDFLPFIFVNLSIESYSVREAFVFIESIRANNMDPQEIITNLFCNEFMKNKMLGMINMAFLDNEDVANFLAVLSIIANNTYIEELAYISKFSKSSLRKLSQRNQSLSFDLEGISTGTWWFLGLTEKMLGSTRGSDWSAHEQLKGLSDDLWNKVEEVRQKNNFTIVPFELLLRTQGDEFKNDGKKTLQGLLNDSRIW